MARPRSTRRQLEVVPPPAPQPQPPAPEPSLADYRHLVVTLVDGQQKLRIAYQDAEFDIVPGGALVILRRGGKSRMKIQAFGVGVWLTVEPVHTMPEPQAPPVPTPPPVVRRRRGRPRKA